MKNTIQINKCQYNNGVHKPIMHPPVKCSVFGSYGPAICKCSNCGVHMPKQCCDE